LAKRNRITIRQIARRFSSQPVMRCDITRIQGSERTVGEFWHHGNAGWKFRDHGWDGAGESHQKPDALALGDGFFDHRLIRLQHRHRRQILRAGFNAGAEGGTGEQNAIRPGAGGIARQVQEPFRHARRELALTRQISGKAVIQ